MRVMLAKIWIYHDFHVGELRNPGEVHLDLLLKKTATDNMLRCFFSSAWRLNFQVFPGFSPLPFFLKKLKNL